MMREVNAAQKFIIGKYGENPSPGTYAVPMDTSNGPAFMRVILDDDMSMSGFDLFWNEALTQEWRKGPALSGGDTPIQRLTELQLEIGYKPGSISPIAMLGLMGEVGEVANEAFVYPVSDGLNTQGKLQLNTMHDYLNRDGKKFIDLARDIDSQKKVLREGGVWANGVQYRVKDEVNFNKELADVFYYLNVLAINRCLTIDDLAQMSYDKVMEKRKTMDPEKTGQ